MAWNIQKARDFYNNSISAEESALRYPSPPPYVESERPPVDRTLLDDYQPPERVYWGALRVCGTSQFEVSVCRPSLDFPLHSSRPADAPRQVKILTDGEKAEKETESFKRSVRRSRKEIRLRVKAGGFDRLLTLTTREIITDRDRFQELFEAFIRVSRIRITDFEYLGVLEYQERGALHMHMAVKGKQDVKWLLRCWLKVLGQGEDDLNAWYAHGVKLGNLSMGSVNVTSPNKKWGTKTNEWQSGKLAGYMSKYLAKDMDLFTKSAKRYWQSRGIPKVQLLKYWLTADTFYNACLEAIRLLESQGITSMQLWTDYDIGNIWVSGSRPPPLRNDAPTAAMVYPCPF